MLFLWMLLLVTAAWLIFRKGKDMSAVFRKKATQQRDLQPPSVQTKPVIASPKLKQYIRMCNASINKFDSTDDLVTKFYEMTLLEKNLKELLLIDPGNNTARLVEQMMPVMRRKVEAKLLETQQICEADPIHTTYVENHIEIEQAWARGDYDWARHQLQRIAYGMVGGLVTDEQRNDFRDS